MPRASHYMVEGLTYHLTHRCHNRQPLLRFARDRDRYRRWLRDAARRYRVPIYGFCITSNHVHVLVHADDPDAVGDLMRLAAGSTARQYNLRKEHCGSMWEHPYQCTTIEDGQHLLNCLCYIDLNMVRAGVVAHPAEWRWCGHDELTGTRQRYRLLDTDRLLESLGMADMGSFRAIYADMVERRIAGGMAREPHWSESIAVGSRGFVDRIRSACSHRRQFVTSSVPGSATDTWAVREAPVRYGLV